MVLPGICPMRKIKIAFAVALIVLVVLYFLSRCSTIFETKSFFWLYQSSYFGVFIDVLIGSILVVSF